MVKTKITIGKDGSSRIEGLEKGDDCYKLLEMAKMAGKVTSDKHVEHVPVYHDVHQRGN
jgi:hypothetical protein